MVCCVMPFVPAWAFTGFEHTSNPIRPALQAMTWWYCCMYMCCLSPCAQPFSPVVMTLVSEKQALTSAPVLPLPDVDKPLELVSDACECPPAMGAVLMQENRPVCFYSCKLSGAELQYCASDIEMQSVIAALQEWRCYLEGSDFTIVTDHAPNTYLGKAENMHTVKRRARWLSVCCGHTYTWVYCPERVNVADPISRAPHHFPLLCVRTALAHSMETRCYGRQRCCLGSSAGGLAIHGSVLSCVQLCCCLCYNVADAYVAVVCHWSGR